MKQRQHFELELELAMDQRNYHPDTQNRIWHLIGSKAVSCEALLDSFAIIEADPVRHEADLTANQPTLFE